MQLCARYTMIRVRVCKETCIHAHVTRVFSSVRGVRYKTHESTRVQQKRVSISWSTHAWYTRVTFKL